MTAINDTATVTVTRHHLHALLTAVTGPSHYLRELQAISSIQGDDCPITALVKEFKAAKTQETEKTLQVTLGELISTLEVKYLPSVNVVIGSTDDYPSELHCKEDQNGFCLYFQPSTSPKTVKEVLEDAVKVRKTYGKNTPIWIAPFAGSDVLAYSLVGFTEKGRNVGLIAKGLY